MTGTRDFNASTVLVDEGELTIDELRGMLAEDIDSVKRLALRYNGIQAELARAAMLVDEGAVDHQVVVPDAVSRGADPDPVAAVYALSQRAATIATNASEVVVQMRDLLEELAAHGPDAETEDERDERDEEE
jgi:hypothetical protein